MLSLVDFFISETKPLITECWYPLIELQRYHSNLTFYVYLSCSALTIVLTTCRFDLTVSERDLHSRSSSELLRGRVRKVSSPSHPFIFYSFFFFFLSWFGSSGTIGVSFCFFVCNKFSWGRAEEMRLKHTTRLNSFVRGNQEEVKKDTIQSNRNSSNKRWLVYHG